MAKKQKTERLTASSLQQGVIGKELMTGYQVYERIEEAKKTLKKGFALKFYVVKPREGRHEFYIGSGKWNNRRRLYNPFWMPDTFYLNELFYPILIK